MADLVRGRAGLRRSLDRPGPAPVLDPRSRSADDDPDEAPTVDDALAKAKAMLAEVKQLQDEFDSLSPEEQAALPASVRQFLGKGG